jgi:D-serine dehydratase
MKTMFPENIPLHLDALMKGIPDSIVGKSRAEIAASALSLFAEDLPLPVAIMKQSAVHGNAKWMREYLYATGASLAPHGKTTMSPELFELQHHDGCWGLTLATHHQVRVARHYGVKRILLANQAVGRQELLFYVGQIREDPDFEFYCYVDSLEGVRRLENVLQDADLDRPFHVLVELGFQSGRTGCRDKEAVFEVARAVDGCGPKMCLSGVAGYEGLYQSRTGEDRVALVRQFIGTVAETASALDEAGLFKSDQVVLTAGGSSYFDIVIEMLSALSLSRPTRVLSRSGCYLTHDVGMYETLHRDLVSRDGTAQNIDEEMHAALEVWGQVLSTPEPELIIVLGGKRDFGIDGGLPIPIHLVKSALERVNMPAGSEIVAVSDQHAHVRVPLGHGICVGDLVGFGVSHPCTTFDKWRAIYLVDDSYTVRDVIQTHF